MTTEEAIGKQRRKVVTIFRLIQTTEAGEAEAGEAVVVVEETIGEAEAVADKTTTTIETTEEMDTKTTEIIIASTIETIINNVRTTTIVTKIVHIHLQQLLLHSAVATTPLLQIRVTNKIIKPPVEAEAVAGTS